MKKSIAVVVSHPIQHFAPWHRQVSTKGDLDLTVLFCCDWGSENYRDPDFGRTFSWDVPLTDGYDHVFLPIKKRPQKLSYWEVDNPSVDEFLDRIRPDVVKTFGYAYRTCWRAAAWAEKHGVPLLLYSDSTLLYEPTGLKGVAKRRFVGRFYQRVSGALAVGDNNRAYHSAYGVPDDRIFEGVMPIDRDRLLGSVRDVSATRARVRAAQDIPGDAFVVLFSGKFVTHKRPADLILAGELAHREDHRIWTLFVGDGPEKARMERIVHENQISNCRFAGFINQAEIAEYYAASDAIAVPSEIDAHPLVVTEGATFGLPVVISDRVGCIGPTDTARPDQNALVHKCGDAAALATRLTELVGDRRLYDRLANESRAIAGHQGADQAADSLTAAVARLARAGPRR